MNWVYVIQDKNREAVGVAYEQDVAFMECQKNHDFTYRMVPFYTGKGTRIITIAGPIDEKYLPKKNEDE
jgi:hypothetical protein